MSERRNESEVERDFATAMKAFNDALSEALSTISRISHTLAQTLESIRKHQMEQQTGAKAVFTSGRTEASPVAPNLASELDQQLHLLSEHNKNLETSLEQLRSLEGNLPLDNRQELNPRLDALDQSIQRTSEQNNQLASALTQPPPQPTREQSLRLEKENIKAAFLGQPLSPFSEEKALGVKKQLDSTLSDLSEQVQKLRIPPTPSEPTERSSPQQELPSPFSKKRG